jgi:hypothetical protein
MWIASQSGGIDRSPWLSFLLKLLRQEKDVIDLIEDDPWKNDDEMPKLYRSRSTCINFTTIKQMQASIIRKASFHTG